MNKMQKIMLAAIIIDLVAVLVILSKFQEIEQSLLNINGVVMLLVLIIELAYLVVTISRKREKNIESVFRTIWFVPLISSLCAFSLVPLSIKPIATSLTLAGSGILILLILLIWFLIRRKVNEKNLKKNELKENDDNK